MKKFMISSLVLAALGVALFWGFMFKDMQVLAGWSIIIGGAFAMVALILFVIQHARGRIS